MVQGSWKNKQNNTGNVCLLKKEINYQQKRNEIVETTGKLRRRRKKQKK